MHTEGTVTTSQVPILWVCLYLYTGAVTKTMSLSLHYLLGASVCVITRDPIYNPFMYICSGTTSKGSTTMHRQRGRTPHVTRSTAWVCALKACRPMASSQEHLTQTPPPPRTDASSNKLHCRRTPHLGHSAAWARALKARRPRQFLTYINADIYLEDNQ